MCPIIFLKNNINSFGPIITMKKLYVKLNNKTFTIISIIFCFIGDLSICWFIYQRFNNFEYFREVMWRVVYKYKENGIDISGMVDEMFIREQFQLASKCMIILFILVILFHLFIYLLFFLQKRSVHMYLKVLTWVAGPGCVLVGLVNFGATWIHTYLFFQGLFYFYVAIGFRYFFLEKKER